MTNPHRERAETVPAATLRARMHGPKPRRFTPLLVVAPLAVLLGVGCGVDTAAAPASTSATANVETRTAASAVARGDGKEKAKSTGERAAPESKSLEDEGAPPPPPPGLSFGGRRVHGKVKAASASSASGRLSTADVESVVDANIDQLGACIEGAGAVVTIRALVAPSGKVIEASAPKSSPDDPRVRDCVAQAFKRLEFPSAAGGTNTPLALDLSLETGA